MKVSIDILNLINGEFDGGNNKRQIIKSDFSNIKFDQSSADLVISRQEDWKNLFEMIQLEIEKGLEGVCAYDDFNKQYRTKIANWVKVKHTISVIINNESDLKRLEIMCLIFKITNMLNSTPQQKCYEMFLCICEAVAAGVNVVDSKTTKDMFSSYHKNIFSALKFIILTYLFLDEHNVFVENKYNDFVKDQNIFLENKSRLFYPSKNKFFNFTEYKTKKLLTYLQKGDGVNKPTFEKIAKIFEENDPSMQNIFSLISVCDNVDLSFDKYIESLNNKKSTYDFMMNKLETEDLILAIGNIEEAPYSIKNIKNDYHLSDCAKDFIEDDKKSIFTLVKNDNPDITYKIDLLTMKLDQHAGFLKSRTDMDQYLDSMLGNIKAVKCVLK